MRRLVTLAVLLLSTVSFGVSISGCSKGQSVVFCNGQNSGVAIGQTTSLDLEPRLSGISLNEGQIGGISTPTGRDCKGTATSPSRFVYGSTDMSLVDVSPADGRLCAGSWNRMTGGGIPDYTVCTPNNRQGVVFVTASAEGVVSNPIPVYVHPVVTSIVLGPASTDCINDPASNCFSATQASACASSAPPAVNSYTGNSCLSQGQSAQLAARTFSGTGAAQSNISCLVGPLSFSALNQNVVSINQTGVATAAQPGSSIINATISQSASSAGFFSTCPPKSIILTTPNQTTPPAGPISVNQNTSQALTTTVLDTNNNPINSIQLEYVSTSPTTIPANQNTITPTFPGAAAITAICQPPLCNSAPFNQIGLFGNGTTVTSNPVQIIATGTNSSTVLYIASTNSQYLQPVDFTVSTQSAPARLPYVPNSMVISEDLSTIYLGSSNEIMVFSTLTNAVTREDPSISGSVLAVSPDSATVVVTDPVRKLVYLYGSSGSITSEYGGVGTRAQWSPDSQTVYITTSDQRLLVYSTFTGWTSVPLANTASDVTITVPNVGVYLAGTPITARANCPVTTVTGSGINARTTNIFYPQADQNAASATRIAATNDGVHILGASLTNVSDLQLAPPPKACPPSPQGQTFTSTLLAQPAFAGVAATAITNVLPTSDSAYALVTYQGKGGVVPQYNPQTHALTNITLQSTASGAPVAPVAGVVSSDNTNFFVGTSGDNIVHRLVRGAAGFADTGTPIVPALPVFNGGGTATPDLLVQKPRKATS